MRSPVAAKVTSALLWVPGLASVAVGSPAVSLVLPGPGDRGGGVPRRGRVRPVCSGLCAWVMAWARARGLFGWFPLEQATFGICMVCMSEGLFGARALFVFWAQACVRACVAGVCLCWPSACVCFVRPFRGFVCGRVGCVLGWGLACGAPFGRARRFFFFFPWLGGRRVPSVGVYSAVFIAALGSALDPLRCALARAAGCVGVSPPSWVCVASLSSRWRLLVAPCAWSGGGGELELVPHLAHRLMTSFPPEDAGLPNQCSRSGRPCSASVCAFVPFVCPRSCGVGWACRASKFKF